MNGITRRSHDEIADTLRGRIRAGELRPGDRLPTQAKLADEFGVERGVVRQALQILQKDGLLSNVTKGTPPRVAELLPTRGEPQSTMVTLTPRLIEAFGVPHVRMDVVCLTSETLMLALGEPIRLIHAGELTPESIEVRVLLPDRNIQLAFPAPRLGWGRDKDQDHKVHQHWLGLRDSQVQVVKHNLEVLKREAPYEIDVSVTFRAVALTPPTKLYLLNGQQALMGYYMVARHDEVKDSETLELHDVRGLSSILLPFDSKTSQRDAAFVEQSQKWFDSLWETIATELSTM